MAYNKGDETEHGIYLGERMVDRETRLTAKEAEALVPANYGGDSPYAREHLVNTLQDRMVVHVFLSGDEEVEIPA